MKPTPSAVPPAGQANGRNATAADSESPLGLLRRLADDLSTLLRKELALATAEVSQTITSAQRGVASVATGGAVLFAGLLFVLLAVTAALAQTMDFWLASLIVGVVVLVVGYVMVKAGKKKLSATSVHLDRTQESLREDATLLKRRPQ